MSAAAAPPPPPIESQIESQNSAGTRLNRFLEATNCAQQYVAKYDGSVVLVSHDVGLMDASVNNIAELTAGTLIEYRSCTYHRYLEEKEFRSLSTQAEYQKNLEEAANLQKFIDKYSLSDALKNDANLLISSLK